MMLLNKHNSVYNNYVSNFIPVGVGEGSGMGIAVQLSSVKDEI